MRISEVAQAAGCSVRAIRHYHASGALPEPERTANGYREYDVGDLAALLRVRTLVEAGIPLAEIDAGEDLYDRALARVDARLAELREQRRRILALMDGGLGLPADIRASIEKLLDDPEFARLETDALDLMGLSGVATETTWEQLRRNLADPGCRRAALRARDAWQGLGRLRADAPEAGEIIGRLVDSMEQGLMAGVYPTLRPGDLPLALADVPVTGAQGRALEILSGQVVEP